MSEGAEQRGAALSAWHLMEFLATSLTVAPPARGEARCMGRWCRRPAEYTVAAIDPNMGTSDHPLRVCLVCLCSMDCEGRNIDIFRWLTNGRIEADR